MEWLEKLDKNRVSVILIKDDKILLIHRFRNSKEYWVLPGGSIEEGESNEEALKREIFEELSLVIHKSKFLFQVKNAGRQEYHYFITDFSGDIKLGGLESEIMNENNQYLLTWLSLSEFKEINNFYPEEAKLKIIDLFHNS